jgi:hypothetical protein
MQQDSVRAIIIIIIIIIIITLSLSHTSFLIGTSPLEPAAIPTAQASISDCSTFRIMRDAPRIAVLY